MKKKMPILGNAFSLNMLQGSCQLSLEKVSVESARAVLSGGFESAVGHASTATVFGAELGLEVLANRANIELEAGRVLVVGQYRGPRLPEGATTLPADATIEWWVIGAV